MPCASTYNDGYRGQGLGFPSDWPWEDLTGTKMRYRELRRVGQGASFWVVCLLWIGLCFPFLVSADDDKQEEAQKPAPAVEAKAERRVFLVRVQLPIEDEVDSRAIAQITAMTNRKEGENQQRPLVVLHFVPSKDPAARSDFGRSMNLARFLTGPKMAGAQTVAYLPGVTSGHAVLPVLACEQLIVGREGVLGPADPMGDAQLAEDYRRVATGRLLIPPVMASAMVDGASSIVRVTTQNGVLFETEAETANLRQAGKVIEERTVFPERKPLFLTGPDLRELGLASHVADSLSELEAALGLPGGALSKLQEPMAGFQPVMVELRGRIHDRSVRRVMNAIEQYKQRNSLNVLFLKVNSRGGDPATVLRLTNYLATELGEDCRTVLVVQDQLRGSALALLCAADEVVVQRDAILGNVQESEQPVQDVAAFKEVLQQVAAKKNRNWSLSIGLLDGTTQIFRYRNTISGELRYASEEEAATFAGKRDQWEREDAPVPLAIGISGERAVEMRIARGTVESENDLKTMYGLAEPPKLLRPNWALELVERLADPRLAGFLMFVGIFAIWIEFNTPGIGVPGFIGGVCLLLFFWSQVLHGNAGWLEALLFLAGAAFVTLEVTVLPGLGIFGIGGAIMMVAAVILASQTFIVPQNAYQFRQLPVSISMVIAAGAGGLASIYYVHRYLQHTPYLNRLLLQGPTGEALAEQMQREAVSDFNHLLGQQGKTTTLLVPAGKAQFGKEIVDVITDGEMVERGRAVVVTLVSGNRVVVRAV